MIRTKDVAECLNCGRYYVREFFATCVYCESHMCGPCYDQHDCDGVAEGSLGDLALKGLAQAAKEGKVIGKITVIPYVPPKNDGLKP